MKVRDLGVILWTMLFAGLSLLWTSSLTTAAPVTTENACIILVLDESGSMLGNDPTYLRNTGARLFISILDDSDQVGLVRFSTEAQRLTPELVMLTTPQDKFSLMTLLGDAPPTGFTDMRAALTEAGNLLQNSDCPTRAIVMLSDGYPELPGGLPAGYEDDTLALVRRLNAPVYGIALTTEGESGFLYRLATATNPPGVVVPARTAADLLDAYLDVLAHLKDRTVTGTGFTLAPGTAALSLDAGMAPYVSRITYVISKPENVAASLTAPGGQTLSPDDPRVTFAYTADPRFAVYTVDYPAPGDWRFDLSGSGQVQARAIIRSRLRIVAHEPVAYQPLGKPMPLAVSLVEEGLDGRVTTLIGEAAFTAHIIRPDGTQDAIDRLHDDGTHGDVRAADGIFSNYYVKTDLPGEYRVTITGYKGIIPAARSLRVTVVPFPQIKVIEPTGPDFAFRSQPMSLAMRLEGGEPPVLDDGRFFVQISGPGGRMASTFLVPTGDLWIGEWMPESGGRYTITFSPQDATYKGVAYNLTAVQEVAVNLIPAITLADDWLELGRVPIRTMTQGLEIELDVVSSSPQVESVRLDVAGAPGLAVTKSVPAQIPTGANTVYVTLAGDLPPGDYTVTLLLSARDGVDVPQGRLVLTFTAYQPVLNVQPATIDLGQIRMDHLAKGKTFELLVASSVAEEALLTWDWQGPAGIHIESQAKQIPGNQTSTVSALLKGEDVAEGSYTVTLLMVSSEGVLVEPATVTLTFAVVPVPLCARICLPLGLSGLVTLIGGGLLATYLANRPRPWGALKPVKVPVGQALPAVLSIKPGWLNSGQALVGSGRSAQLRLTGGQIQSRHAAIKVTRQTVQEKIGRPPKMTNVNKLVNVIEALDGGVVKVNGVAVPQGQQSLPLKNGTSVTLGEYEFIYEG
jgi:hypothetical protein